jgi:multidrug efflux system membrane fusion protein
MSEETPKSANASKAAVPPAPETDVSPHREMQPATAGAASGRKRRWLTIVVSLLVLVLVVLFFRAVFGRKQPVPPPPAVPASTVTAQEGDIGINVEALGVVTPLATVSVPSQVSGQLTKVNFVEGQIVHAGDVLAEIDPRPFEAQLVATEGQLARDQALLAEARMDLERYKGAYEQRAIPKQQLDDQQALVDQEIGTVKFDQGQVDSAKVQLGFCRITAFVSGRIGLRLIDPGNVILSSSTNGIAVITQLQPITVIFAVAEDYLPQIQHQLALGNQMAVQALDRAKETNLTSGVVLALDSQIDTGTGTIRIRAIFSNENNVLFPNQFVNARLLIDTLHNQTLIPTFTIQRNAQATSVFVVKPDQTIELRPVKVVATDGDTTAVQGVKPGETLAADNFNRLQNGVKVSVRKTEEAQKPSGP